MQSMANSTAFSSSVHKNEGQKAPLRNTSIGEYTLILDETMDIITDFNSYVNNLDRVSLGVPMPKAN